MAIAAVSGIDMFYYTLGSANKAKLFRVNRFGVDAQALQSEQVWGTRSSSSESTGLG